MEIYLIRHGETDQAHAPDPFSASLTERGRAQAQRIAEWCVEWGIEFLCTSPVSYTQQTADAISERLPQIIRWDLDELEDVNADDLLGDPLASPLVERWTAEQLARAYEHMWNRVMAALTHIQLYAQSRGIKRVAIVAHQLTLQMLLLAWTGRDWRALLEKGIPTIEPGASCKLVLEEDGQGQVVWMNRK
ncbi:MAG: histidine phosphatase family protein [Anaerolineae bacterium]|nr:histidine phosphatase family protein [Anaerolineae bacterium]